ncbi:MAG: bifunctional ADP-heptose synthase [Gammaproteobacteria bacterium]|nr:bifunctional ADP-heptose synthase [Gammaproteobacteria bacterium]
MDPDNRLKRARDVALRSVDALAGRRILVAGDFLLDRYLVGQATRVSREAPVVIIEHESDEVRLGGAGNAARNVRALGGEPIPLGLVGRDREGERVVELLREAGIDTHGILRDPERRTVTKTRILAGAAGAASRQVLRIDRAGDYGASRTDSLIRHARALVSDVDAVLLSDYGYATLAPALRSCLIQAARTRGLPSCADSRYQLSEFQGVTVATPNEEELARVSGGVLRSDADVVATGRELLSLLNARAVVVTRGSRGMSVFEGTGHCRNIPPARHGEVADVTGAGDTVASALVLALAAGTDILVGAMLANATASVVVGRRGAATAAPEEVVGALEAWQNLS